MSLKLNWYNEKFLLNENLQVSYCCRQVNNYTYV